MGSVTAELDRGAGLRLRQAGSLTLVAAADAPAFLDACLRNQTRVLGIEGFRVLEDAVQPDMTAIADLSDVDDQTESVAEAIAFVEAVSRPEFLFDFVLESVA